MKTEVEIEVLDAQDYVFWRTTALQISFVDDLKRFRRPILRYFGRKLEVSITEPRYIREKTNQVKKTEDENPR